MDKLQELTQKLYEEGLSKGKAEGEEILQKAKAQADEIIKAANEQAEEIIRKARKEAQDYKTKLEGDVKMAATQTVQATRESVENLVIAKAVEAPVKEALKDSEYVKEIITEVARKFSTDKACDLSLVLPENLKAKLGSYVEGELAKAIGKGVDVSWSGKMGGGFRIGPKDGSYYISLSDDSFAELIGAYMRPATKQLLFG